MPRYDLAVAGAGLGGLATAALLARHNKRAVLVDPSSVVGGALSSVRKGGFVYSPGPSLSFGFERGGALQDLCSELGISQNASVHSPCYQVALPDRRISVFRETGETLEELRREFPREIDAIARFYQDLRKASERTSKSRFSLYWSRRRKTGPFVRGYRFSREFRTFLDIPALYFFQQPAAELSLSNLITLFDTAPLSLHEGFQQLCDHLLAVILKNGGEVRHGEPHSDISHHNGEARGLALSSGPFLEAATVLVNAPLKPALTTVFLGVRDEVIPVGMSRDVLCLPDYGRPDLIHAFSIGARENEGAASRNTRALTVSFPFLPQGKERLEALMTLISGTIPFLDRFLVTAETQGPGPAAPALPSNASPKALSDSLEKSLLCKTSVKHLYVLPDDQRSPLRAVSAARELAGRLL